MVKLVFIRGAPAVGKTTITKEIIKLLKVERHLHCAYILEDDFRKQMQFKYKARDLIAHKNSVELIKTVILKLLELDDYDIIFIEGQFRYKDILDEYAVFLDNNKFDSIMFQFQLDIEEMKKRDINLRNKKSKDIVEVKTDIDSYIPENAIIIDTKNQLDDVIKEVLKNLFE
ncbi:hypothetical protein K9L67_02850 [Candidatus Woesearchaeota archaeon]|nr:hypothetical protein [Candidatus Woesearchaeota archaeon]MCF7901140.1 hypothetical protein [Candidatus Woesearchaeota archaeon]MCF8013683.1 hypothetical protein [Candidatus Woesearchaeota archaeon]